MKLCKIFSPYPQNIGIREWYPVLLREKKCQKFIVTYPGDKPDSEM